MDVKRNGMAAKRKRACLKEGYWMVLFLFFAKDTEDS